MRDKHKASVTTFAGCMVKLVAHPLLQPAILYTVTVVLLSQMILQIYFGLIDYNLALDFCSVCTI